MKLNAGGDHLSFSALGKIFAIVIVLLVLPVKFSLSSYATNESYENTNYYCDVKGKKNVKVSIAVADEVKIRPVTTKIIKKTEKPKTSEQLYYPIIVKVSLKYEVDPLLVKAVIVAESGFNAKAVSRVGAQGLMQLMPRTAKELGVVDSFNPEHNINGGVKYLKQLLDKYDGDIKIALAAYNAGCRKVKKYKGVPPYKETRKYIKRVSALHERYKKSQNSNSKERLVSQS